MDKPIASQDERPDVEGMVENNRLTLVGITAKTIVVHTLTYFFVGLMAFVILDYANRFAEPGLSSLMRQTDDPIVLAGPLFQPLRGILFGVVFYLLRDVLFGKKRGWLVMWVMLAFVGIFSTFGPAPGSIEGMVFTTLPIGGQIVGWSEVLVQSLALSFILTYWVDHPEKRWLTWVLVGIFAVIILISLMGIWARSAGLA